MNHEAGRIALSRMYGMMIYHAPRSKSFAQCWRSVMRVLEETEPSVAALLGHRALAQAHVQIAARAWAEAQRS